ncbi:MAG: hypothetical protein ACI867_000469 [Glaciecola sp.]|jgi:hypothetical protein
MEQTLVRMGLMIHIVSAMALMAGLVIELLSGHLLTRAEDTSQVRVLGKAAEFGGRLAALSLLVLLLSGPDLASRSGFFEGSGVQGWVAIAIVMIVVMGAAGGMINRRTFKALVALAGPTGADPVSGDLRAAMAKPTAWISMHTIVGATLAIIWLMSNKPLGVVDSIVPVLIGAGIGAVAGVAVARLTSTRLA